MCSAVSYMYFWVHSVEYAKEHTALWPLIGCTKEANGNGMFHAYGFIEAAACG